MVYNSDDQIKSNNKEIIIEKKEFCFGRLYYSLNDESKLVYAQLFNDKILLFIDEECMSKIGNINLSTITDVKLLNKQTFELHSINQDKIYLFTIYDTDNDDANIWVNILVNKCNIQLIDNSAIDDDDKILSEETYNNINNDDNIQQLTDETRELLNLEYQIALKQQQNSTKRKQFLKRLCPCIFGD